MHGIYEVFSIHDKENDFNFRLCVIRFSCMNRPAFQTDFGKAGNNCRIFVMRFLFLLQFLEDQPFQFF